MRAYSKKLLLFLLVTVMPALLYAKGNEAFDLYFLDATMRIDFFFTGDADENIVTIDQIYKQGSWAGNPYNLIDPFNNGAYFIKVYDIATNALIYSKGFNCIYNEYKTTNPALEGMKRTYHNSALIPFPKRPVLFVIEMRDRQNLLRPLFSQKIEPDARYIIREKATGDVKVYRTLVNGNPHEKVDLVWLAEGYSADEFDTFKKDVDRYKEVFFSVEPFRSNKKKFNIYGVFKASSESGVDQPRRGLYTKSAINASFNALDLERYLLTEDNKAMRDIAAHVPYDGIVILVNSERYGGGGIYNDYAISTVNHTLSENVFLHEFGHSFGGLGDEYYSSSVVYNEFYPKGFEPTEPNVTAFLDSSQIKWHKFISSDIDIPTDWGKEQVEELQESLKKMRKKTSEKIVKLKAQNADSTRIIEVEEEFKETSKEIQAKIHKIRTSYEEKLKGKVGLFEGAGYSSKGLYRPEINCMMYSNKRKEFCKVCQHAIKLMIEYYSR